MKPATILFILSIFYSPHGLAWTILADFEHPSATADTISNLPNPDSFHDAAGQSRYADTPALSGSQSGSVTAHQGETGFGRWGGGFIFPEALGEGDEVWYRVNVFYPTGWSFSCSGCSQGLKFMRIIIRSDTGGGFIESLIMGDDGRSVDEPGTGGTITAHSDMPGFYGTGKTNADIFGLGERINRQQWYTYETYVKFSSVAGQGIFRIWQDGNLIFEDLVAATLLTPTSTATRTFLYTYWNSGIPGKPNAGAPITQTSYVDDIVITNEIPSKKDANGNSYIGVGASIYIAPPKAPITNTR